MNEGVDFSDPTAPLPEFRFWLWIELPGGPKEGQRYLVGGTDSADEAESWAESPNHLVMQKVSSGT